MIFTKVALMFLVAMVAAMPSQAPNLKEADTTSLDNEREHMLSKREFGKHFGWSNYVQTESKTDDLGHNRHETVGHNKIKRADPVYGVFECAQPNFQGICKWTQIFVGEKKCHNRAFTTLGSLGPDVNVICTVYSAPDCVVGSDYGVSKDGLVHPGVKTCAAGKFWKIASGRSACPTSWACDVQLVRDASWFGSE